MASADNSSGSDQGDKLVIRAQRRRPSGPADNGPRERADAPRRESGAGQSFGGFSPGRSTSTGSSSQQPGSFRIPTQLLRRSGSAGGGASGGGGRCLLILGLVGLVFVCIVGFVIWQFGSSLFSGAPDATPVDQTEVEYPTSAPVVKATSTPSGPQPTAVPFVAPTTSGTAAGQKWLVMLYQDADDKTLEEDIFYDLNEAERVGSTDNVRIVAQVDRYAGGFNGDGNWTSTRRYFVKRDNDLNRVGSQLVADLGEKNMADGNTLVDFVTWAVKTFPSDKLVLILSDHGMGWPGGWSDPAPATRGTGNTPLADAVGNELYLNQLDSALVTIRERAGIDKLEVIGLDACLMGQLEVVTALAPHARYAVVSEETEPALGWAYYSFLKALAANPGMSGADLSKLIVSSYVSEDQRIVDDDARAGLVGRGSPMGGLFGSGAPSSAEVADQMGADTTLSAIDLSAVQALNDRVNDLCVALQGVSQKPAAQARTYAQSYTSVFGQEIPPSYIDLGSLVQLLQQTNAGAAVNRAAANVAGALKAAVIAEKHGPEKPGSTGLSIYFPNSQLYRNAVTGPASYTVIAGRFAATSLWDDYLAYHYTGRAFTAAARQTVVPSTSATVTAPGQGKITMTKVKASASTAAPGKPVVLSTDITAQNLGHVMLFAGFYDKKSNSLYVADMDYLESSDTRQVNGIYYPVWPNTTFTLEFEWEPIVFYISDGKNSVPALLTPESYGATAEEAIYSVDGAYTFAGGETRTARLYFRDGVLQKVYGFTGDGAANAPREIHPQAGDKFTVFERWLDLDAQGRISKQATQQGGTLTFGSSMFTWKELDAAAGDYVVGFIAEDLDGNKQQAYAQITVK